MTVQALPVLSRLVTALAEITPHSSVLQQLHFSYTKKQSYFLCLVQLDVFYLIEKQIYSTPDK